MKPWDKRKKFKEIESGEIDIDPTRDYSRTQATRLLNLSTEAFGTCYRHSRLWLAYEGNPILEGRAVKFNGAALIRHTEKLTTDYYECKLYMDKWRYDHKEMTLDEWYEEGYKLPPEEVFDEKNYFVLLEYSD